MKQQEGGNPTRPDSLNLSVPQFNATSSISSAASNSTMRSVYGGTICRSPVPRPPLSANKVGPSCEASAPAQSRCFYLFLLPQAPAARTPGGGKPPHPRLQGCNKENVGQLKGSPLTPPGPQSNSSLASVSSTYSQFVVIHSNPL